MKNKILLFSAIIFLGFFISLSFASAADINYCLQPGVTSNTFGTIRTFGGFPNCEVNSVLVHDDDEVTCVATGRDNNGLVSGGVEVNFILSVSNINKVDFSWYHDEYWESGSMWVELYYNEIWNDINCKETLEGWYGSGTKSCSGSWSNVEKIKITASGSASSEGAAARIHELRAFGSIIIIPTVLTSNATNIQETSVTLNGNITDIGGENANERGFEWGTSPGVYPNNWTESGSFGTDAFSHNLIGLTPGTPYYFRAKAHNSAGWGYGGEESFITTLPSICQNHNVRGWAWSENIGWLSFSCENCDSDLNGYIDVACGGDNSTTPSVDYGVDIDPSTGLFSGYAWSENIGWISFEESDLTDCPSGTCHASIDLDTAEVSGWARALSAPEAGANSGGWDGWIKLSDTNYGVWLDSSFNPNPTEFRDFAWGGDPEDDNNAAVIGLVSFNSKNCDVNGNGIYEGVGEGAPIGCPTSGVARDYKVMTDLNINNDPTVDNLNVSGAAGSASCLNPNPSVILSWNFNDPGDTQSAYSVQIGSDVFNCPGPVGCGSESYSPIAGYFSPGTNYSWRVMVWDSAGQDSDWSDFSSFTTDVPWPQPSFTWEPSVIHEGQEISFINNTNCPTCAYSWDFDNNGSVDSTLENPTHTYLDLQDYIVSLTATDSGHSCAVSNSLTVKLPIPKWKEIIPF